MEPINFGPIEGFIAEIKKSIAHLSVPNEKKHFSFIEASSYLGIAKSTLYKHTSSGNITYFKPSGKLIIFKKEDLDKWIEKKRVPSNDELKFSQIKKQKQ